MSTTVLREAVEAVPSERQLVAVASSERTWSPPCTALEAVTRRGLQHQRSCTFTSATSPCIQKATANLSQIQDRLDAWRRELLACDAEIRAKSAQQQLEEKQRLKSTSEKGKKLVQIDSGKTLEIIGTPLDTPASGAQTCTDSRSVSLVEPSDLPSDLVERSHTEAAVSESGIPAELDGALQGVFHLLGRLETDRVNTAQALDKEHERVALLSEKIDTHAYRRMEELPKAVQDEHMKCAENITELKWHCTYRQRIHERLKERVKQAETINTRIRDEIGFVEENSPLLDSKLELEKRATQAVQNKQDMCERELKIALEQLRAAESSFEKARYKIEMEQRSIKKRIGAATHEFDITRESLDNLMNDSKVLTDDMAKVNQKMREIETEIKGLELKQKEIIASDQAQKNKVAGQQHAILEQKQKNVEFQEENEKKQEKFEAEREQMVNQKQALEQKIKQRTGDYKKLIYQNRAFEKDIKILIRQIQDCKKQQNADAKAVTRSSTEKGKIDMGLQVITEEADQIRMIHDRLMLRLEQERSRVVEVEENLTMQSELLKKQVKEESHARIILQARIQAETADFGKKKIESEKKRAKILKTKEEIEKVIDQVQSQVEKLTAVHDKRIKVIEGMKSLLEQVATKRTEMEEKLKNEIATMQPEEERLKTELTNILSEQDDMSGNDAAMTKKMEDMEASMIMMRRVITATKNTIEVVREELDELTIQRDSSLGREESLKGMLTEMKERSGADEQAFGDRMEDRGQFLENTQEQLERALAENKRLAAEYLRLQNLHINSRMEFTGCYEKSLNSTDNLKDTEVICSLHARLHEAMKSYYRLRGLQTRAGLSRFEQMNQSNSKKLAGIEDELKISLKNIESFLSGGHTQIDATITDYVMENMPPTVQLKSAPVKGTVANISKQAPLKLPPRGRGVPRVIAGK